MNIAQIEEQIQKISRKVAPETFIYDLLGAYGKPKASLTRLQNGTYNLSKADGEILWKKNLLFKVLSDGNALYSVIDSLRKSESVAKHGVRFVVVTDYKTLLAVDTKTGDSLDTPISELGKHFDFFLPWAGFEKTNRHTENPADIKAAERMAKLYDEIRKDNPIKTARDLHSLNIFLSRLLFCFFAEDTEIFGKGLFTNSVASYTSENGSDLAGYLNRLFNALNVEDHKKLPKYLADFPYVNGGLFADKHSAPEFSRKSRKMVLECGELDWSAINPDIFGSMIQAVVHPDQRGGMGMHYTSVTNIMKVIEPLFLNELREEFALCKGNTKKIEKLLARLRQLRVFDPACGSGNFLIIAYKELRKLEMDIFQELQRLSPQQSLPLTGIRLSQFYGIELNAFAHEIAILSLWLAEHQMNIAFKKVFGQVHPSLPLREGGNIVCGNAARLDWNEVGPKGKNIESYILGNPPYLGSKNHEEIHKADIFQVFSQKHKGAGTLDYISCWVMKAANFIRDNEAAQFAFVSTNSICQGEQVSILWPSVLKDDLEIGFAHHSFKWTNSAKNQAAVICIIVGVRRRSKKREKYIFRDGTKRVAKNINAYLADAPAVYVERRSTALCALPEMGIGNKPIDEGNYLFLPAEKDAFLKLEPKASRYFFRWYGSQEFLKGIERWCILPQRISDSALAGLPEVKKRIANVSVFRKKSDSPSTQALPAKRFHVESFPDGDYIVIPKVSSERRDYIPVGFFTKEMVSSDLLNVVYSAEPWVFGALSSKMHMVWVRAVAGRLKTDYRHSSELCYNTFPVPEFSEKQKETIASHVFNILQEREKHSEHPLGDLYDPDLMPEGLKAAHAGLDSAIERCYRSSPFRSDAERLESLFSLYVDLIGQESERERA